MNGTAVPRSSRPRMAPIMTAMVFTSALVIGSAVNAVSARLPLDTPDTLRSTT